MRIPQNSSDDGTNRCATRRTLIGALGMGSLVALAGCVGDDDTDDSTDDTAPDDDADADDGVDDDADTDDNGEPADTDDEAAEQLDSPTEFPDGAECAVCSMVTPEYPEWNAQLVKTDGTRVYFCSSGCMLAYVADPERFGGEGEAVENVWVTDYETGELIDGDDCYYVRVDDSDHVDDIMMMNPTPFETRESAKAFVGDLNDEHDASYDPDADIITFDEFDMELATMYRSRFFDDEDGDGDGHGDD